jgi:hypothetical protein
MGFRGMRHRRRDRRYVLFTKILDSSQVVVMTNEMTAELRQCSRPDPDRDVVPPYHSASPAKSSDSHLALTRAPCRRLRRRRCEGRLLPYNSSRRSRGWRKWMSVHFGF